MTTCFWLGLLLSTTGNPSGEESCLDEGTPEVAQAYRASALGLDALTRGDVETAVRCLRKARLGLPTSEVIARDLALALGHARRLLEARRMLKEARRLGDPEGALERALVSAELGDRSEALIEARRAGGIEGDALAAALDDPRAIRDLGQGTLEDARAERPLVRLILARAAAERGALGPARSLVRAAEIDAEKRSDALVLTAARVLRSRLGATSPVQLAFRVGFFGEHLSNPGFDLNSARDDAFGLRSALALESAVRLGSLTWFAGASVDQRWFPGNGELSDIERGGLAFSTSVAVPFSDDLRAAELEFGLRVVEVRADGFRRRVGTGLEGGPLLRISVAPSWWGELGVYGVWTDFEEPEDPAFDRDRVGQRARLALRYESARLDGVIEITALHDEAEGAAFDALGLSFGGRVDARLVEAVDLSLGLSGAVRRWGPVGDSAFIGDSDITNDLRLAAELGARYRVAPRLFLVVADALVRSGGARGYVANELSVGVEAGW